MSAGRKRRRPDEAAAQARHRGGIGAQVVLQPRIADWLLDRLASLGIDHVFTLPGLQIDPLNRALAARAVPQAVVANHELAAGYMADGYARARGGAAAVFAIGGPGCANLVGAAVAANADRSPVLFVTGNLSASARGAGAFQDGGPEGANDVAVMAAALGDLPAAGAQEPQAALCRLRDGCPAHLQLDHDRQLAAVPPEWGMVAAPSVPAEARGDGRHDVPGELLTHGRTLLFADSSAIEVAGAIGEAAARFMLPVATCLAARGVIDEHGPFAAGHLGFMPHPRAEALLSRAGPLAADRVLHLGADARWQDRLRRLHPQVSSVEPRQFAQWLQRSNEPLPAAQAARRQRWLSACAAIDRSWPGPDPGAAPTAAPGLTHADVVDALQRHQRPETIWVVDAGQVRRVAVARLRCRRPRSLLVAEGMAPMGWSLGAAVGAALARPRSTVVALLGDGAMRMHGIEIASAARYRLPIVYVLFDNRAYGSVLARMATPGECAQARLEAVDWAGFARAFGVPAVQADDAAGLQAALATAFASQGPQLIVVRVPAVDADAYAQPSGIDWPRSEGSMSEA